MIDINKELKRMAKDFNLTEKEVVANWRSVVRFAWGKSAFKLKFLQDRAIKVKNENTRSMKRYPVVTKYKCEICGGMFGSSQLEIDHIVSENTLKDLEHAEDFMKNIFFTSVDGLQILCKDKKRKVKGKYVVERFGCHSVKTFSERYNVSFEEALLSKQIIDICKDDNKLVDKLKEFGYTNSTKDLEIPKTKKGRKELIDKLMREGSDNV